MANRYCCASFPLRVVATYLFRRPRRGSKSPSCPRSTQPARPSSGRSRGARGWLAPAPSAPPRTTAAPSRATRRTSPTPKALRLAGVIPLPGLRGLHTTGMTATRRGTTSPPRQVVHPLAAIPPPSGGPLLLLLPATPLPSAHHLLAVTVAGCTSAGAPPGSTTRRLTSRCSRYGRRRPCRFVIYSTLVCRVAFVASRFLAVSTGNGFEHEYMAWVDGDTLVLLRARPTLCRVSGGRQRRRCRGRRSRLEAEVRRSWARSIA